MIISDSHRFAFIHVPKCAGTSVRKCLDQFDDRNGLFANPSGHHPALGAVDLGHLPLFVLREHFAEAFEAVREYWSFALVRDPFDRFASSLAQRIAMYGDRRLPDHSLEEVEREVDRVMAHLRDVPRGRLLTPDYIHFQPQVDYLFLDGQRVVQSVYRVDQIDRLLKDVSRRVGIDLLKADGGRVPIENRSITYRNDAVRRVAELGRLVFGPLATGLPEAAKRRVRSYIYAPRDKWLGKSFRRDEVRQFIADYYRDDIAFWNAALAGIGLEAAGQ